ncbi:MAG: hypothetical protein PUE08_07410, partial [Eubacteriales bacterium]|nr:hypothetical protein [Eubacteriales bacterium]
QVKYMKKFYLISTSIVVAVLVIFEIVMYFFVGEDALATKGIVRTIWIIFPIFILALSFLRDFIIKKHFDDK